MPYVNPLALAALMESSRMFHKELTESQFWPIIKNEPVIISWLAALDQVENELKKGQNATES